MQDKQPFRMFRKKAGLKIDETAKKFGVDRTTIIRWEKGKPMIPLKRLDDAKEIIGATKQDLRPDIYEGMESAS
jgi:transcriptional regulator with XRE-family HTH domain